MLITAQPADESGRVALLHHLQLLTTPPRDLFDCITRLAAEAFSAPIALVSLVDSERQWNISRVGFDVGDLPRDMAFCAHAIQGVEPLVVENVSLDHRFSRNPMVVSEPHIRFYAGAPILSSQGLALGALCVLDTQPREFSAAQLQKLKDFATLARQEIVHREALLQATTRAENTARTVETMESRLRATFDQAAVGMALVGLDGQWLRVNRKICEIVGYTPEELSGLTFQDITHPDDLTPDLALVNQLLAGEIDTYTLEKRYLRKTGEIVWINLTAAVVRDGDGKPSYFVSVIENIHARKEAQAALRSLQLNLEKQVIERTQQLRAALINAQDAYIMTDESGRILDWNPQAEKTFGWLAEDVMGQLLHDLLIPEKHREAHLHGMQHFLATGYGAVLNQRAEFTALCRDGREIPVELSVCTFPSGKGHRFSAFLHDISERKEAEAALQRSRQHLRAIADNVPAMIAYFDTALTYRFASAGYRSFLQLEPGVMIGCTEREVMGAAHADHVEPYFHQALGGQRVTFEVQNVEKGNYWQVHLEPDFQEGSVVGFYAATIDITDLKHSELAHKRLACLDVLTELPNRRGLMQRLSDAMARAKRSQRPLGLLFLDLNGFKQINDQLGHPVGDDLLRQFAYRVARCVRQSDLVARLAGDEFVVVIEALSNGWPDAQKLAEKITRAVSEPFELAEGLHFISASIGIYVPDVGSEETAEMLLAKADLAMYEAKHQYRNAASNR